MVKSLSFLKTKQNFIEKRLVVLVNQTMRPEKAEFGLPVELSFLCIV